MRTTRFGAIAASTALAATTILGGAGIAQAEEATTDTITSGGAEVTATANENCEIAFEFGGDTSIDRLNEVNWVVDYRVDGEEPNITNYKEDGSTVDETLSVYHPVVASNEEAAEALVNKYDYDVGYLNNTVNLNDVVEPNETGEHTVKFNFYRGATGDDSWHADANQGEITVTGCDTADDSLLGSVIGSVDVFGSLEGMS